MEKKEQVWFYYKNMKGKFRKKEDRDKYRYDTFCSDKNVGKNMYVYPYSSGEIKIDNSIYDKVKKMYQERNK